MPGWPNKELHRLSLYKKQDEKCFWCKKRMNLVRKKNGQPSKLFATFEHVIRVEDGGQTVEKNLVLAHRTCNLHREIVRQSNNGKNKPRGMKPEKWKRILALFSEELLDKQERLGKEFEGPLYDNLWDLYAR